MRVHELAKELGVKSKELLDALEAMGYAGRTASSSVPDETVARLRASGGKAVPGAKPRQIEVEQLPAKPKRRKEEPPKETEVAVAPPVPEGNGQASAVELEAPTPAQEAAPVEAPRGPALPALKLTRGASPQDVAAKTGHTAAEVVGILIRMGEMVSPTRRSISSRTSSATRSRSWDWRKRRSPRRSRSTSPGCGLGLRSSR